MTAEEAKNLVEYTLDLGSQMIECGAEAWRADDMMMRIFRAYDLTVINSHTMATQTIVSIKTPEGERYTSSCFINPEKTSTNLEKMELINSVARYICEERPNLQDLPILVRSSHTHWSWKIFVGYVLGAGSFAIFFGGNFLDGFIASIIAIIVYAMECIRSIHKQNKTIYTIIACFVAGLLAHCFVSFSSSSHLDMIIIGDIMLFIPGLALVNGVRELFYADILTGIYRITEAILGAGAIALGYSASIVIGGVL